MPTLTVIPTKDNHSGETNPTSNYGTLTYLYLAAWSGGNNRSMLAFAITDLPVGAKISAATFSLYYEASQAGTPAGRTMQAFKITGTRNDWHEEQSTWNIYKTGSNWTAAGGDWVTSNPSGATQTMPAAGNWLNFDIKAIVEDAVANTINVNLIVKYETEGGADTTARMRSREYTVNTSLRPKLVIEYTIVLKKIITIKWDIISYLKKIITIQWNINNFLTVNRTIKWDIPHILKKIITLKWDMDGLVKKVATIIWNINNELKKEITLKWNISHFVKVTRTIIWNIGQYLKKIITLIWIVIERYKNKFVKSGDTYQNKYIKHDDVYQSKYTKQGDTYQNKYIKL